MYKDDTVYIMNGKYKGLYGNVIKVIEDDNIIYVALLDGLISTFDKEDIQVME